MNRVLFYLLLGIVVSCCKNQEKLKNDIPLENEHITKEEALNLLHKWTDAYLAGNAEPLNDILDETWIYSGSSDGSIANKSSSIEEFSNADYKFADITYNELDVRLYKNIAIVTGSETMLIVGESGIDTTKLRLRFTDVYRKKNGLIKAISTHSSPVNDD